MPHSGLPHWWLGAASLAWLLSGLLPTGLPEPTAPVQPSRCEEALGIGFPSRSVDGPLTVMADTGGSGTPKTLMGRLAPLVGLLQTDLGTLSGIAICVLEASPSALPPDPDLARELGKGAAAAGSHGLVVLITEPLASEAALTSLAEAAAVGIVHVAFWQHSAGAYPAPFDEDVVGWYLGRLTGRPSLRPEAPDPAPPQTGVSWDTGNMTDLVGWDPGEGYGYAGEFTRYAVAETGIGIVTTPDDQALQRLAMEWQESRTRPPAPGGSVWPILTLVAVTVALAAALASVWWRSSRPVPVAGGAGASAGVVVDLPPPSPRTAGRLDTLQVEPPAATPLSATQAPASPVLGESSPASDTSGPVPPWGLQPPHAVSLDAGTLNGFAVRSAASIGTKNRLTGIPCQDAFAVAQAADRFLLAAVCDGVGTARHSHLGAQAVAESVVGAVGSHLQTGGGLRRIDPATVIEAANRAIHDLVSGSSALVGPGDFATTLALLVVDTAAGRDDPAVVGIRVGDSTIRVLSSQGEWTDLFGGDAVDAVDSLLSTATVALPCEPHLAQMVCVAWWDGSPLVAMTDGLANPMRDSAMVRAHLKASWAAAPAPLVFAADLSFRRRGVLDDRTAVAVWRPPGGPVDV